MVDGIVTRPETEADYNIIRRIHIVAFPSSVEAMLVDDLRIQAKPTIGVVAELGGELVGHIMFSPVSLRGQPDLRVVGLAPMSVVPEHQGKGVGAALVASGLELCREQGVAAVVVLGHADYYPRFGFVPASSYGISSDFEVPDEAFMALELNEGALADRAGRIRYHPAFDSL
ncbi:MAG: N-acetyltransferase [Halieaceae bacterium]